MRPHPARGQSSSTPAAWHSRPPRGSDERDNCYGMKLHGDHVLGALTGDPELQQRLAKYMVLQCFRNSLLEDLHSGITPSSASGDYSDVFVTTPYGEIPWPRLSRLSDEEMKSLMIDVVNRTYQFLHA